MFTAAQAAQKRASRSARLIASFTAAQAAQKRASCAGGAVGAFTAAQAAQKKLFDEEQQKNAFTAAQAAQKVGAGRRWPCALVHCRTGSSEMVTGHLPGHC